MGLFISFEGGEGSGKSTQIRLLAERLTKHEIAVLTTREPGGCPIADRIRSILLDADSREMTSTAELLLYAAARAQHVDEVLRPGLEAGNVILCDRYCDATIAYQGYGRNLDRDLIATLNSIATGGLRPDLTIFIDCPPEVGLQRAFGRIRKVAPTEQREERFEMEHLDFHRAVRSGYASLAAAEPDRVVTIDGTQSIQHVASQIEAIVMNRLQRS